MLTRYKIEIDVRGRTYLGEGTIYYCDATLEPEAAAALGHELVQFGFRLPHQGDVIKIFAVRRVSFYPLGDSEPFVLGNPELLAQHPELINRGMRGESLKQVTLAELQGHDPYK